METTQLVLRREAQRARYRHAWWVALAAGLSGNALLVLAVWAAAPRAAPAAVSVMPTPAAQAPIVVSTPVVPPVIVVIPAQPAAAPASVLALGDLGPCPAPSAARPSGALRQPQMDDEITGFAGAPTDSRWLAVWSRTELRVSRDGGASWDRVLDGPGDLLDASFDCHGRVLALRDGNGLGIRDGAREAWRAVPGVTVRIPRDDEEYPHYQAGLVGGGRSIAVVGPKTGDDISTAYVAISDDGGATWHHEDLGWYEGRTSTAWDGDTLRVAVPQTDCMSEGIRLVTITGGGSRSEEIDEWSQQIALHNGAVHGVSWDCPNITNVDDGLGLCTWRQGKGWKPVPLVPVESGGGDNGFDLLLIDGPVDVLVRGLLVQTVGAGKLGRARQWPEGAEPLGTDLAGRLWGKHSDDTLIRR